MRLYNQFSLQTREWGEVRIARILPVAEDPWGPFAVLQGTPWGAEIQVVTGEDFSHALHGHATPLMRGLRRPPVVSLRRIPPDWRPCEAAKGCIAHQQSLCQPCPKVPDCYSPPKLGRDAAHLAALLALAWRDGIYVVVVQGSEFTL